MGFFTWMKYMGLAMEAAEKMAQVTAEIAPYKDPNSPGGTDITHEEKLKLAADLDDNFSEVVTRICQEAGLEIKSVNVTIEI